MSRPAQPEEGVRYEVTLEHFDGNAATYRGHAHVRGASYPLAAVVEAGSARCEIEGPEEVRSLEKPAAALIRAAAKLPRAESDGPPPRRVVRWRPHGLGEASRIG